MVNSRKVIFKPTICLLILLSYGETFAQLAGSAEKSAFRHIEKQRWQKAETRLRKTLQRDTLNPSVRHALSIFYFHPGNPQFDIDSAYHYVVGALQDYDRLPVKDRERLARGGPDSLQLVNLRAKIDSAAFEVARSTNTEAGYLEFLSHFPSAVQRDLAIQLRDEVAYDDALKRNTYDAFYSYLNRYPESARVPEARAHYHRLLYFEETRDKRLRSYERFLVNHPETPYLAEIYRNIFEISTADGQVESCLTFMSRYPQSELVGKAKRIAFHLLADQERPEWPAEFLDDSLRHLVTINRSYLVPFLKDGRYGFMDEDGREVIAPRFQQIHADYLCGHVTDEILIADHQLLARNGSVIFHGAVTELEELGAGFLMIEMPDGRRVIHKSGFSLAADVEDARVVAGSFIAIKRKGSWLLHAFNGRLLDSRSWDDIHAMADVLVFVRDNQKFMIARAEVARGAEDDALHLSEPFGEARLWPGGLIWGKSGEYEGVIDQSLQSVIRFDKHQLTPTRFGAVAALRDGFVLYSRLGKKSPTFDQVNSLGKTIAVRKNARWFLYNPVEQKVGIKDYDSLRAEGAFVIGTRADSVDVHFENGRVLRFFRPGKISFIPGLDSMSFLTVQERGSEKTVYDLNGGKLFTASFDALEYAGKGFFVVTRNDRKGLLDSQGALRLPLDFDAIGTAKGDVVSLLRNRKFGAYNTDQGKFIKPQYDRNLVPYGPSYVITFKEGRCAFLGWDNKAISAFEFEEVRFWNDSLALVKKGSLWSLFDLKMRKLVETNLRGVTLIKDTPGEKIAIIQRDSNFGVITNHGKVIIPPTFTEVTNLGSADMPLYFTEKHVPEASLYIVIYYDRTGEMLRKEIYDDATEYDRIYCSDN